MVDISIFYDFRISQRRSGYNKMRSITNISIFYILIILLDFRKFFSIEFWLLRTFYENFSNQYKVCSDLFINSPSMSPKFTWMIRSQDCWKQRYQLLLLSWNLFRGFVFSHMIKYKKCRWWTKLVSKSIPTLQKLWAAFRAFEFSFSRK